MDILSYLMSKKYTDQKVGPIKSGMVYMGSVANYEALPTPTEARKGQVYTTSDNGYEYVCDGEKWVHLGADVTGKLDKMPGDAHTGGQPYNLPYFFYTEDQADKVVVHAKTRSLDGNNVYGDYSLDVNAATTDKAGLLSAADKVKFEGKQDKLTAGTNITISADNVISATGGSGTPVEANVEITGSEPELFSLKVGDTVYQNLNYHPFPEDFKVNKTLKEFGQSIVNYAGFATGCTWFGGIQCSDLPCGLMQVECKVTAIRDKIDFNRNIAIVEIYSSEVPPFYWHYNTDSWNGGTGIDDWKFVASIDESKFAAADVNVPCDVKVRKINGIAGSTGYEFYTEKSGSTLLDGNNVGVIAPFAGTTIPAGYLECNGAAVSRTTYAELFRVIGTTYGSGDGSTTFNLPNLQEKFIEGSSTAKAVGSVLEAGLPNISGTFTQGPKDGTKTTTGMEGLAAYDLSGAFSGLAASDPTAIVDIDSDYVRKQGEAYANMLSFDASKSNAIYGKSDTVQPAAVVVKYIIKYANTLGTTTNVIANPTLAGTEANLTGLQVGDVKYKVAGGGEPAEYVKRVSTSNNDLTFTLQNDDQILYRPSGWATTADLNTEISNRTAEDAALQANINTKLDKPVEPVAGQGINVPYFFDVNYAADKVTVKDYTIDLLDKSKAPQQFSLDISSATQDKAGLLSAADKKSIDDMLPAYPEDTTSEYVLALKYENGAWVKYWKETVNKSDLVDKGMVDYMVLKE